MFDEMLSSRKLAGGHVNRNDRMGALFRSWGHIATNQIQGDYYEFGVFQGDSLVQSFQAWSDFKSWVNKQVGADAPAWRQEVWKEYSEFNPRFVGVDTFEGMPDNDESSTIFAKGTFQTSLELVEGKCESVGLSSPELTLVKGLFADTDKELIAPKAAIINVDGDLYQSAVDALELVKDSIQQGTVLLMDDYNMFNAANDKGERRALLEFCERTDIEIEPWFPYQFVGQAFLCHRLGSDNNR